MVISMILSIIISIITISALMISIVKFPNIRIKGFNLPTFWIITLIGALLLLLFNLISFRDVFNVLSTNNSINPLKILILFISMSLLSIILDEVGFFRYLANKTLKFGKKNQIKLFIIFYIVISILTIFTSNDIIILTFTPFICFFSKKAKINPIPYLVSEFVAANTFSMMLCIGNPTNIYLSSVYEIGFYEYLKVMFIPSLLSGICAFILLFILFKNDLKKEIEINEEKIELKDCFILIISLIHLILCTITLTISNFIGFEMWLICLGFASSIIIILFIYGFFTKKLHILIHSLLRAPWNLVPFILSMFIIILCLDKYKILINFGNGLNNFIGSSSIKTVLSYGIISTISCNIVNNIPMTLGISKMINALPLDIRKYGIFSSIIGSNLGAYLSPIGALAGILFMSILKDANVKYKATSFIKYGLIIVPCVLLVALISLYFVC